MNVGFWQIALVVVLFLLLFGRGRVPQLMGDLAAGLKHFRKELRDDENPVSGTADGVRQTDTTER